MSVEPLPDVEGKITRLYEAIEAAFRNIEEARTVHSK